MKGTYVTSCVSGQSGLRVALHAIGGSREYVRARRPYLGDLFLVAY